MIYHDVFTGHIHILLPRFPPAPRPARNAARDGLRAWDCGKMVLLVYHPSWNPMLLDTLKPAIFSFYYLFGIRRKSGLLRF